MAETTAEQKMGRDGWTAQQYLSKDAFVKYLEDLDGYDPDNSDSFTAEEYEEAYVNFLEAKKVESKITPKVKSELRKLFEDELSGTDVRLESGDLDPLDVYVDSLAEHEPDELKALQEKIQEFTKRNKYVKKLRRQKKEFRDADLEDVGDTLQEAQKAVPEAPVLKHVTKFFGKKSTRDRRVAEARVQQGVHDTAKLSKEAAQKRSFEDYGIAVDEIAEVAENVSKLQELQEELFQDLGPVNEVMEKVRLRIKKKFEEINVETTTVEVEKEVMIMGGAKQKYKVQEPAEKQTEDLTRLNKSEQFVADLRKSNLREIFSYNPDEGLTTDMIQDSEDALYASLEAEVANIVETKTRGRNFREMERALMDFIKRTHIGDKVRDDAYDWKVDTLTIIKNGLAKGDMKKAFLNEILGKLERGEYVKK